MRGNSLYWIVHSGKYEQLLFIGINAWIFYFYILQKLNPPSLKSNRVLDELVKSFVKVRLDMSPFITFTWWGLYSLFLVILSPVNSLFHEGELCEFNANSYNIFLKFANYFVFQGKVVRFSDQRNADIKWNKQPQKGRWFQG